MTVMAGVEVTTTPGSSVLAASVVENLWVASAPRVSAWTAELAATSARTTTEPAETVTMTVSKLTLRALATPSTIVSVLVAL